MKGKQQRPPKLSLLNSPLHWFELLNKHTFNFIDAVHERKVGGNDKVWMTPDTYLSCIGFNYSNPEGLVWLRKASR